VAPMPLYWVGEQMCYSKRREVMIIRHKEPPPREEPVVVQPASGEGPDAATIPLDDAPSPASAAAPATPGPAFTEGTKEECGRAPAAALPIINVVLLMIILVVLLFRPQVERQMDAFLRWVSGGQNASSQTDRP
jgi:hypothetical protein